MRSVSEPMRDIRSPVRLPPKYSSDKRQQVVVGGGAQVGADALGHQRQHVGARPAQHPGQQRRAQQRAAGYMHDQRDCRSAGRSGTGSARCPSAAWSGRAAPAWRRSRPASAGSRRSAACGRAWRSATGAAASRSTAASAASGADRALVLVRSSGALQLGQLLLACGDAARLRLRRTASAARSACRLLAQREAPAASRPAARRAGRAWPTPAWSLVRSSRPGAGTAIRATALARRARQQAPVGQRQQARLQIEVRRRGQPPALARTFSASREPAFQSV